MQLAMPVMMALSVAGTAFGAYSQYQAGQYQAAVAQANADLAARQAMEERHAADLDMQDKDLAAKAEIAELVSQMNASGLTSTTGTMLMRRQGAFGLAARDRERLGQKRDTQFENTKRQQQMFLAESREAKRGARMSLLSGFLDVGSSALSSATMVNNYKRSRIR